MNKSQIITNLKTALSEIEIDGASAFKTIFRGPVFDFTEYPVASIVVPVYERYIEPSSGNLFPKTKSLDILIYVLVTSGGDTEFNDTIVDELTDLVREKLKSLTGSMGVEWIHDEDITNEDNTMHGAAMYFQLQIRENQ
jgi:hypothetical protein